MSSVPVKMMASISSLGRIADKWFLSSSRVAIEIVLRSAGRLKRTIAIDSVISVIIADCCDSLLMRATGWRTQGISDIQRRGLTVGCEKFFPFALGLLR